MKNLGKYHNLYLNTDMVLLADVFENIRKTCFETYSFDLAHYYTAPGAKLGHFAEAHKG